MDYIIQNRKFKLENIITSLNKKKIKNKTVSLNYDI